jgi:hypothetical protein
VEYLHLFGLTAYAYMWARMANVAQARQAQDPAFHGAKLDCAAFYFQRVLPRGLALEATFAPAAPACMGWRQSSSETSAHRGCASRGAKANTSHAHLLEISYN